MSDVWFDGRLALTPLLSAEQQAELGRARAECEALVSRTLNGRDDWCQWDVSDDGRWLTLQSGGKFAERQAECVERLVREYLAPWGISLDGEVRYGGAEYGPGSGRVHARGGRILVTEDCLVSDEPEWE